MKCHEYGDGWIKIKKNMATNSTDSTKSKQLKGAWIIFVEFVKSVAKVFQLCLTYALLRASFTLSGIMGSW
jgi:hypothetical protein